MSANSQFRSGSLTSNFGRSGIPTDLRLVYELKTEEESPEPSRYDKDHSLIRREVLVIEWSVTSMPTQSV